VVRSEGTLSTCQVIVPADARVAASISTRCAATPGGVISANIEAVDANGPTPLRFGLRFLFRHLSQDRLRFRFGRRLRGLRLRFRQRWHAYQLHGLGLLFGCRILNRDRY
jgi:hypothetical protein